MLGSAGVLALFFGSLLIGARLIRLGKRTHQAPPLLVALGLVALGPAAFTLAVLAVRAAPTDPALSRWLAAAAGGTSTIGTACAALVMALVFRRASRLGWVATGVLVAGTAFCWIVTLVQGDLDLRRTPSGFRMGYQTLQLGTLLWASVEAMATWKLLRGRLRLGLADPLVVNRIGLWSVATGSAALAMAIGFFGTFFGLHYAEIAAELSIAAAGLAAVTALWLAFLPPARYRAYVLRRSPGAPTAADPSQSWPLQ